MTSKFYNMPRLHVLHQQGRLDWPKTHSETGFYLLSYTMGNTWQVQLEGLALALLTLDMFV